MVGEYYCVLHEIQLLIQLASRKLFFTSVHLSGDLECKWSLPAHETPITDVKRVESSDYNMILTSGQESTVKAWMLPEKSGEAASVLAQLMGHKDAVQSITISPSKSFCSSASWDCTSRIWPCGEELVDLHRNKDNDDESGKENGVSKKRKVNNGYDGSHTDKPECIEVEATQVLQGHTGSVAAVEWEEEETIVSGGWDHSVSNTTFQTADFKVWDG